MTCINPTYYGLWAVYSITWHSIGQLEDLAFSLASYLPYSNIYDFVLLLGTLWREPLTGGAGRSGTGVTPLVRCALHQPQMLERYQQHCHHATARPSPRLLQHLPSAGRFQHPLHTAGRSTARPLRHPLMPRQYPQHCFHASTRPLGRPLQRSGTHSPSAHLLHSIGGMWMVNLQRTRSGIDYCRVSKWSSSTASLRLYVLTLSKERV